VGSGDDCLKVVKLLIDTGANFTVLPPDLLIEVGCDLDNPLRRTQIAAAGGLIQVPIVEVPWFNCVGKRVAYFPVVALKLPAAVALDGLLGMDFLKMHGAILNIKQSRIGWEG
jgi:predicted aspartyl protease